MGSQRTAGLTAAAIVCYGLSGAASPIWAMPISGHGICVGGCPGLMVNVRQCNGPEPAFGPYRPFDELKPFTLRSRCPEPGRAAGPPIEADRAGRVRRPAPQHLHRGSPFTGLSGNPHAFGPIFRQRSYFYSSGQ